MGKTFLVSRSDGSAVGTWDDAEEAANVAAVFPGATVVEIDTYPKGAKAITVCIHCSMEAFVAGAQPPVFGEWPAAHAARVHPHGIESKVREALERKAAAKMREQAARE